MSFMAFFAFTFRYGLVVFVAKHFSISYQILLLVEPSTVLRKWLNAVHDIIGS